MLLETTRGGYSLLVSDGSEGRRWSLGLGRDGELQVVLRAPCYPLLVALRETMTLTPGARLHGYVQVPLVPTVVWHDGVDEVVCELLPRALASEWQDDHCVQRCTSPWLQRLVPGGEDPVAVVPVHLRNESASVRVLGELPLELHDSELYELRGQVLARPRRFTSRADGALASAVRGEVGA